MKILKKVMAIALTTSVVLGCGTTINAASSGYKIDDTFPDKALNKYVRQYDLNNDGYLDSGEISKAGKEDGGYVQLRIKDPNILDLDGIEIFESTCDTLILEQFNAATLDLTTYSFKYVGVSQSAIKTFICGKKQKELDLSECSNLKNTYFNNATALEKLTVYNCPSLTNLYVDNCSEMKNFTAFDTGLKGVYFSDDAHLKIIKIYMTPLQKIVMKGTGLDSMRYFYTSNCFRTMRSLSCKADLSMLIASNPVKNNGKVYGYEYEGYNNNGESLSIRIH